MQVGISTNLSDILGRWKKRASAIEKEQRRAAREMAPVLQRASENILRKKVYSVPIPRSRSGKPAWRRTGNLIASEKWYADGTDVVGTNTSDHAEFRLLLGTPYGRQIKSPGVQQVDWHVEALKEKRGYVLQMRAAANRRALQGR